MTEHFVFIKKVDLNNNCPICYNNDGLELTCSQKIVETNFYKKVTSEIKYDMACGNCKSTIYPVNWTDDIERVFEYHKKAFKLLKPSTHLKRATWLAILSGVILAICMVAVLVYSQL
ncbi:hypothetical protein EV196_101254 [Mariniflexile fucanivorans]|uniref:Uncharacterized protein n=1 Tax=Mariniflexile fucanivorans TaxID=264023 RepID=A0A4R1RQX7_9FLAO|nr:hypothetical protein [Mariniflexile fucanivorans]TCL68831.1 hypothetical protein EV196_101254 [Mariniflexile fucanivorans]